MTRTSQASLAWISRSNTDGELEILVQWNQSWQALSLIGGHVEPGETFLAACSREIEEELQCSGGDYQISRPGLLNLVFEDFSKSAQALTHYAWQVYSVVPSDELLGRLPRNCTWVTSDEIRAQQTRLGLRIADQVRRVLDAISSAHAWPLPTPLAGSVSWTNAPLQDLSREITELVNRELLTVYRGAEIVVKQRFRGYHSRPEEKLILAIEVRKADQSHANVVKLGPAREVGGDTRGWKECATDRGVTSRLFIAPHSHDLPNGRVMVVYPDVYQFYFDNGREHEPSELEGIVKSAISHGVPSAPSVERVLTQLYSEAHRCFYHNATAQDGAECVKAGLQAALHPKTGPGVLELWRTSPYQRLRRGAAWLTCGSRQPQALERPPYIDPVDYLQWAMTTQQVPPMLVGPAHGDLHARNIIVGQARGEAEWPAVIDFDRMSSRNIVAWDFAKLELELKCRLFQHFLEPLQRQQAAHDLRLPAPAPRPQWLNAADEPRVAGRVKRMETMFAIERRLSQWTNALSSYAQASGRDDELLQDLPQDTPLGRGMRIIFRIRREAAIYLGYEQQGRELQWRDEYYFALLAYGVIAAKWHSTSDILLWALISSGVSAAQLSQLPWPPDAASQPDVASAPTYLHVLPWAAKSWEAGGSDRTIAALREAHQRFPYSVAVTQQLALLLAQSNSEEAEEEARRLIAEIEELAIIFRDHETLCRLGRVYKERGDRCFTGTHSLQQVINAKLPMYQAYLAAFHYYNLASEVSDYNYYPSINAATLALLTGKTELQRSLAQTVLQRCGSLRTDSGDRLWILASEGEASLLLGLVDNAIEFYRQALACISPTQDGVLRSIYEQLCRLHWALGPDIVQPAINLVLQADIHKKLPPSPFGRI
jgi:8-oxo-dGTP pyrophosphatase MutT (NUDIX family)/tetratricopeptide (TPR) repeat protein